ncbi:MAG: hypothetical protein CL472_09435 [Acidobacteria bacterium]|nr:hypothetical protein [Acidobacteriota bacterium]
MLKSRLRCVVGPCAAGLAVAILVVVQVGCGGSGVSESGTDQIGIDVSSLRVAIENKSGLGLINVKAMIEPAGLQKTGYTALIGRLENAQTRNVSFSDFRTPNGTPFSPRGARVSAVRVTAEDLNGQAHEAVVPWGL